MIESNRIMPNYKEIDIQNWDRKEHYLFFKDFDIPFFNITANVDITTLHDKSKEEGFSLFLAYLFYSLKAAHQVEAFKYRILEDDKVVCYDIVHPGTTAINENNIFKYTYLNYHEDLMKFISQSEQDLKEQIKNPDLKPNSGLDLIYYSSIPWVSFTSFQHARKFSKNDCIPRIMFGKFFKEHEIIKMPVSVEVNHALMDGYHVGQFIDTFQNMLNTVK